MGDELPIGAEVDWTPVKRELEGKVLGESLQDRGQGFFETYLSQ